MHVRWRRLALHVSGPESGMWSGSVDITRLFRKIEFENACTRPLNASPFPLGFYLPPFRHSS